MTLEFVRCSPNVGIADPNCGELQRKILDRASRYTSESVTSAGTVLRSAHATGYGLARGEVDILGKLPAPYAQGICSKPGRHEAMGHFSNSKADTVPDADWDAYIDDFSTRIPNQLDVLFSMIEGWPGIRSPKVKDFLAEHDVTADAWYVANPRMTVAQARPLEKLDKALSEFLDKIS